VTAVFSVGAEAASISACIVDRGYGLRLAFEDRDWQKLWHFANSADPPSLPPPSSLDPPAEAPAEFATRVLLVDPDRALQRSLASLIEESGYLVSVAGSAADALQRLRDLAIDLLVLESVLPDASGIDLCKQLRSDARLRLLPVVFVSRRGAPGDVVAAFEAGADDYVVKPIEPLELRARLGAVLRRSWSLPYSPR
jgi:CheY-like chemotaxis protein